MKCYYHPEVEAVQMCTNCGKAICGDDTVDVSGKIVCKSCLAKGVVPTSQAGKITPSKPMNVLAVVSFVLGIIGLCGGLLFSVSAGITGYFAVKQLTGNKDASGMELAQIGKWMGIIVSVLWILWIILNVLSGLVNQQY